MLYFSWDPNLDILLSLFCHYFWKSNRLNYFTSFCRNCCDREYDLVFLNISYIDLSYILDVF